MNDPVLVESRLEALFAIEDDFYVCLWEHFYGDTPMIRHVAGHRIMELLRREPVKTMPEPDWNVIADLAINDILGG